MTKQTSADSSLDQVIADYLNAIDAGQAPDTDAILARHPQWRQELEAGL